MVRTERATWGVASGLGIPGLRSVGRSQRLVVKGTQESKSCYHLEPAKFCCRVERWGGGVSTGMGKEGPPDDTIGIQGKIISSQ